MDVQKWLDDKLAANAEAQKYVSKVWFIPVGQPTPDDVTHVLTLRSASSPFLRELTIGLVVKPEFVVALDAILAMVTTQPKT
jgi:hypothetical protein